MARAFETLEKMSKLQALFKGLNRTVGGKRVRVAEAVDAELISMRSDITAVM